MGAVSALSLVLFKGDLTVHLSSHPEEMETLRAVTQWISQGGQAQQRQRH